MSEPDEDRVVIPRDDFHVCTYRRGKYWHFVLIFPGEWYFEWDSWLDGGLSSGCATSKDAETVGILHLTDTLDELHRLQAEGEAAYVD